MKRRAQVETLDRVTDSEDECDSNHFKKLLNTIEDTDSNSDSEFSKARISNKIIQQPKTKKKRIQLQESGPESGDSSSEEDGKLKRPKELQENDSDSDEDNVIESYILDANNSPEFEKNCKVDSFAEHFCDISTNVNGLKEKSTKISSLEWPALNTLSVFSRNENHINVVPKGKDILKTSNSSVLQQEYGVRKILADNWENIMKKSEHRNESLKNELFTLFNSYIDVEFCQEDILTNLQSVRESLSLHIVNHVMKSRINILNNDTKLSAMSDEEREQAVIRDQGLTRPKVLILVPFRSVALEMVNNIISLFHRKKLEIGHFRRFKESFKAAKDDDNVDTDILKKKPIDYQELFKGNSDEHFRIGISFLRGSIRLFAPFYSSDIIIASPLGLRTVIGSKDESHFEHDFLSSIEMVVCDQADIFLMQNWEHLLHVFQNLHQKPKDSHGVDFSRVRNYVLDGNAKNYCQTIILSATSNAQISALISKYSRNYKGAVLIDQAICKGTICEVGRQVPQIYHKLNPLSHLQAAEERFKFFVDRIYNQYKDPSMSHTLIYIPQYYDFVRVRNFMRGKWKEGSGPVFSHMSDYSSPQDAARARKRFVKGKSPLLLYTERYHFYNRPYVKGIRHIIFYDMPVYPKFYSEMCNMVQTHWSQKTEEVTSSSSILVMYSRFSVRQLKLTVGSKRCKELLASNKSVHMFLTGSADD